MCKRVRPSEREQSVEYNKAKDERDRTKNDIFEEAHQIRRDSVHDECARLYPHIENYQGFFCTDDGAQCDWQCNKLSDEENVGIQDRIPELAKKLHGTWVLGIIDDAVNAVTALSTIYLDKMKTGIESDGSNGQEAKTIISDSIGFPNLITDMLTDPRPISATQISCVFNEEKENFDHVYLSMPSHPVLYSGKSHYFLLKNPTVPSINVAYTFDETEYVDVVELNDSVPEDEATVLSAIKLHEAQEIFQEVQEEELSIQEIKAKKVQAKICLQYANENGNSHQKPSKDMMNWVRQNVVSLYAEREQSCVYGSAISRNESDTGRAYSAYGCSTACVADSDTEEEDENND